MFSVNCKFLFQGKKLWSVLDRPHVFRYNKKNKRETLMLTPPEIAHSLLAAGEKKARLPLKKMFLLAALAGAYIALAGVGATAAAVTVENDSLAKLLSACVFPAGLSMVILAGSELFTGNCLMVMALLERYITPAQLLRNWGMVYLGNAVGGVLTAALAVYNHTASLFSGALARSMLSIAESKAALGVGDAFLRGILCNFLVCLAVWMAAASKRAEGKIVALFFPILLFVLCGYEPCIAKLYYLPAGVFAAAEYGLASRLTLAGCLRNLAAVTLGNLAGGAALGVLYHRIYLR